MLSLSNLELLPSFYNKKLSMGLRRHRLLEPTSYLPTSKCDVDMDQLFNTLGCSDLNNLVMDGTMSPDFKGMTLPVATRQVGWTKINDFSRLRSFLTVLSNGGGLCLYSLYGDEWKEDIDISKLWREKSALLWETIPEDVSSKDLLKILRERAYRLRITSFAWTSPKSSTTLLFTGSMDGTICAWELTKDTESKKLEAELLRGLETEHDEITSLTIIQTEENKCLLVYCLFNGQIQAISVSVTDVVEFGEPSDVWDEKDGLVVPPSGIEAEMILGYVMLAVAKGPYLLVFLITAESQLISYTTFNCEDVFISGLKFISPTDLLVTTCNGLASILSVIVKSDTSIELSSTAIEVPQKTENYGIMGLALSKSKAVLALAYSVKDNFNHLTVRELSFTMFGVLPEIVNPLDVIKAHTGSLFDIWDALEAARIDFLKNSEKDPDMINSVIDTEQFDAMEITQLKKNLWFLNALVNSNAVSGEEKKNFVELGKEVYNLITAHHVFKRSSTLLADESKSSESLASLSLMRKWILHFEANLDTDNFPSTQEVLNVILEQLNKLESADVDEVCSICGADPEENDDGELKNWRCCDKHEIPRCSISFLQCNVVPYFTCRSCHIIAHPEIVKSENQSTCIYCDGFLQLPDNMLDTI